MDEIKFSTAAEKAINMSIAYCNRLRHEFVMPEHLLHAMISDENFHKALGSFGNPEALTERLENWLGEIDPVPADIDYEVTLSVHTVAIINQSFAQARMSEAGEVDLPHLVAAIMRLDDSYAAYFLAEALGDNEPEFLDTLIRSCNPGANISPDRPARQEQSAEWKRYVTCMNDYYASRHPLIGRERELARTIQVLCRFDKNNPLHVGEPGVGKTALVWGLARMIEEGDVPARLKGSRIYMMDMATLLAGTQYRGDFESRLKSVVDGIMAESDNNIAYIDEIHTLVGAGAVGEGAMDASNMLKPYLESGKIRFIGSTTYEEFNRYFSRSKGLMRRFSLIDIAEPSPQQAKDILRRLLPRYEEFHGVSFDAEAVDFAVDASVRHISGRSLPDKAIDLIDEAGAAMQLVPADRQVGKKEIAEVLAKMCNVDALADASDSDSRRLESLEQRMKAAIYGQDPAVEAVVEAVQMARAGLDEEDKPLASLLFVGPTGVGKTEVAKVLAAQMGMELVRFDMSEYAERHAVAKLIGAPAGYVGYDDGGLLTDAVRKTPACVLLLDEIEKAHPDIFNILLQVMDYGRLTDNKGRHADFRNAVVIMTSNAGAQFASQPSVGFNSSVSRGQAMMKQVRHTFRPEFLNRLSATVIFNDMDLNMARLVLDKKLGALKAKLHAKNVELTLSDAAFGHLLQSGFSAEYGAREMDRVIARKLKPLLMREILFGSLRQGGHILIDLKDGGLSVG